MPVECCKTVIIRAEDFHLDVDGDGDVAISDSYSNFDDSNHLLLNDGSGVFTQSAPDDFATAHAYRDLVVFDAATHPIVKLRATLIQGGDGETPQLRRWTLTFQLQYEPTAVGLQGFDAMAGASEAIGVPWLAVLAGSAALVLGYRARTSRFSRRP